MEINLKQRTPEWNEFRKDKIGASDAAAIMGESPWKTRTDLWEEKKGIKEIKRTFAMTHGNITEEFAIDDFQRRMLVEVYPKVMQSDKYHWMIALLDGISDDGKTAVEVKCPLNLSSHAIAAAGEVPRHYWIQIQHQMEITGLDKMYYSSFFNDQSEIIEVERDNAYIKKLIAAEEEFYVCLITNTRPELTECDYEVIASQDFFEVSEKYKEILESMKILDEEKEILREQIIEMAHNKNVKGNGLCIKKVVQKGKISFKNMPYKLLEELEPFRGKDSEIWRIMAS